MKSVLATLLFFIFIFPNNLNAQEHPFLTLSGHKEGVNVCSFSPDGTKLISGSKDGIIKVWDVAQNYKAIKEISLGDDPITALQYNHKGDKFSVGTLECFEIYNAQNYKRINRKKKAHVTFVKSGNFSPDDVYIVTSSWKENALVVWETNTLKQVIELAEPIWTDEASFTPDGNYIISGNHDNNAKIWDVKTGNIVKTFAGHSDWVYSVKVTSDMKTLITGSFDKTVKLWDFKSGKLLYTFEGHQDGIATMALAPNNQWLASASVDGVIKIWDLNTQTLKFTLAEKGAAVLDLEFSPDGKSLVSTAADNSIFVWDISNLK